MGDFNYGWICGMYSQDYGFWIRVFGYGISVRDVTKHSLLFSERYGYTRYMMVGKWVVRWLPRYERAK